MMLYIFIVITVATSFAVAYECFDSQAYIKKTQPVHEECKRVVAKVVKAKTDCDFAYFIYGVCHNRAIGINNKYQQIDHTKLVELFKSYSTNEDKDSLTKKLSVCENEKFTHGGDLHQYFDCLAKQCADVGTVRTDYKNSKKGLCG